MPNWCYNSATLHHDSKEVIDGNVLLFIESNCIYGNSHMVRFYYIPPSISDVAIAVSAVA
jgi:hypothetical protein